MGHDQHLLPHAGALHEDFLRPHFELDDSVFLAVAENSAFGYPLQNVLLVPLVGQYITALMGNGLGRLGYHQALGGRGAVDPAAGNFIKQGGVVELRVISAQRQLEAVLALGRTVAGARRASDLVENRHDVAHKRQRSLLAHVMDRHADLGRMSPGADVDLGLALARAVDQPVFADPRIAANGFELGFGGEIDLSAVLIDAGDQNTVSLVGLEKGNRGRLDNDLRYIGVGGPERSGHAGCQQQRGRHG